MHMKLLLLSHLHPLSTIKAVLKDFPHAGPDHGQGLHTGGESFVGREEVMNSIIINFWYLFHFKVTMHDTHNIIPYHEGLRIKANSSLQLTSSTGRVKSDNKQGISLPHRKYHPTDLKQHSQSSVARVWEASFNTAFNQQLTSCLMKSFPRDLVLPWMEGLSKKY